MRKIKKTYPPKIVKKIQSNISFFLKNAKFFEQYYINRDISTSEEILSMNFRHDIYTSVCPFAIIIWLSEIDYYRFKPETFKTNGFVAYEKDIPLKFREKVIILNEGQRKRTKKRDKDLATTTRHEFSHIIFDNYYKKKYRSNLLSQLFETKNINIKKHKIAAKKDADYFRLAARGEIAAHLVRKDICLSYFHLTINAWHDFILNIYDDLTEMKISVKKKGEIFNPYISQYQATITDCCCYQLILAYLIKKTKINEHQLRAKIFLTPLSKYSKLLEGKNDLNNFLDDKIKKFKDSIKNEKVSFEYIKIIRCMAIPELLPDILKILNQEYKYILDRPSFINFYFEAIRNIIIVNPKQIKKSELNNLKKFIESFRKKYKKYNRHIPELHYQFDALAYDIEIDKELVKK